MGNIIGSSSSSTNQHAPETWSRCYTEGDTATHNFEIASFSLLEGQGAGHFVTSGTFGVGGCEWEITFYPDGSSKEGKGTHASVFLRLCEGKPGVKVMTKYSLGLWGNSGQVCEQRSLRHTFNRIGETSGYDPFVDKSKLLPLDDDCLTIRCVLTVLKENHTEENIDPFIVPIPPSNFHQDFQKMLHDEEGADVTFIVGDQSFNAHRSVLASRSPFFKAELFGEMKENDMEHIKIDDMEPSVFKALLHFIYTDTLPENRENTMLQHLLVAADRYRLDRLAAMCEGELCQSIDVNTLGTSLTLAEQHGRKRLKNACIGFLSSRYVFGAIKETDGFKHLVTCCPEVMGDILEQNLPLREVVRSQPRRTPGWLNLNRRQRALVRRVVFRSVCILAIPSACYVLLVLSRRGNGGGDSSTKVVYNEESDQDFLLLGCPSRV